MAVGNTGVAVHEKAGVAFLQMRLARHKGTTPCIVGLVSGGASVADYQYPGRAQLSAGWQSDGRVFWTLPGPAPLEDLVTFAEGDRVMLVLDCRRTRPLLRLLVNGLQRLVHPLQFQTGPLFPAMAVYGYSGCELEQQDCVETEATPADPDLL